MRAMPVRVKPRKIVWNKPPITEKRLPTKELSGEQTLSSEQWKLFHMLDDGSESLLSDFLDKLPTPLSEDYNTVFDFMQQEFEVQLDEKSPVLAELLYNGVEVQWKQGTGNVIRCYIEKKDIIDNEGSIFDILYENSIIILPTGNSSWIRLLSTTQEYHKLFVDHASKLLREMQYQERIAAEKKMDIWAILSFLAIAGGSLATVLRYG